MCDFTGVHIIYTVTLDIFRLILGFIVAVAGGAVKDDQKKYLIIVDNHLHFTWELNACNVIGVLVLTFSIIKTLTSCQPLCCRQFDFGCRCCCQCVGQLFTTLLFMIAAVNFGFCISASTKSTGKTLEKAYFESANRTFLNYESTYVQWDHFQRQFDCCGVSAASDYVQIFHQANIVPASCCNLPVLSSQGLVCSDVVANVTSDDLVANRIYNKGCVESVIPKMTENYIVAAIILVASFMLLLENLVLSCIISICLCVKYLDDN